MASGLRADCHFGNLAAGAMIGIKQMRQHVDMTIRNIKLRVSVIGLLLFLYRLISLIVNTHLIIN
jgi:hypothetical protein